MTIDPSATTGQTALNDNGDGTYTYTSALPELPPDQVDGRDHIETWRARASMDGWQPTGGTERRVEFGNVIITGPVERIPAPEPEPAPAGPLPSVGRIVHYRSFGTPGGEYAPACRAAIIAEVIDRTGYADADDEVCAIVVLNPTGLFFNTCPHVEPGDEASADAEGVSLRGGTWHWPERT